jgi:hypothetical protein
MLISNPLKHHLNGFGFSIKNSTLFGNPLKINFEMKIFLGHISIL